jgi:hypothetical protein
MFLPVSSDAAGEGADIPVRKDGREAGGTVGAECIAGFTSSMMPSCTIEELETRAADATPSTAALVLSMAGVALSSVTVLSVGIVEALLGVSVAGTSVMREPSETDASSRKAVPFTDVSVVLSGSTLDASSGRAVALLENPNKLEALA